MAHHQRIVTGTGVVGVVAVGTSLKDRVLLVGSTSTPLGFPVATLQTVALTGGHGYGTDGAGIGNYGTLTLVGVAVSGNYSQMVSGKIGSIGGLGGGI